MDRRGLPVVTQKAMDCIYSFKTFDGGTIWLLEVRTSHDKQESSHQVILKRTRVIIHNTTGDVTTSSGATFTGMQQQDFQKEALLLMMDLSLLNGILMAVRLQIVLRVILQQLELHRLSL